MSQQTTLLDTLFRAFSYVPLRCQACGHRFRVKGRVVPAPRAAAVASPAAAPARPARAAARPARDRRDFDRHAIRIPVTIVGTRGTLDAVATDLSVRGCAVETSEPLPTVGPFAITLRVAGAPIEIAAARTRYADRGVVGVEFRQITPAMQARLADYVAKLFTARQG